jgi:hypothetical protein
MYWQPHVEALQDGYYTVPVGRSIGSLGRRSGADRGGEERTYWQSNSLGRQVKPASFLQDTGFFSNAELTYYDDLCPVNLRVVD